MRSRVVRVTLLLLAVGALGTAAYLTWQIDRRNVVAAEALASVDWKLEAGARQAIELRAAQQAYVATGQSEQFWITRVTESVDQLQNSIAEIRGAQLSPDAVTALDRASQSLTAFTRIDRRAREYASTGQKLLASDVIFSDGLERTQQVLTALDDTRTAQAAAGNVAAAGRRRELATAVGAGVGVALLVLLLLTSTGRPPVAETVVEEPMALPERKLVPPAKTASLPKGAEPLDLELKPKARAAAAPAPAPPPPAPARSALAAELLDVAEVCAQLARVADSSSLPSILQRTAVALDAAGLVLWVMEPDGTGLVAVASHGYAPGVLARMGPIGRDAENVTAAAFRTGLVQTVKADPQSNGAIAAPLVNASGCVGVLSAEVRKDGAREPARLALASIVAAQLATLTAPAARAENRAAL